MLGPGSCVFVHNPSTSQQRVLRQATVVGGVSSALVIQSYDPALSIEAGGELVLFFQVHREFIQQSARVDALLPPESLHELLAQQPDEADTVSQPSQTAASAEECTTLSEADAGPCLDAPLLFAVQTLGEPVSAESRECFRVCTVTSGLKVGLGDEKQCQLLDVSVTGFSVRAMDAYSIGQSVTAVQYHKRDEYAGTGLVQSVKELATGYRYGIHCADQRGSKKDSLVEGLQKISMDVQRRQLRRRTRA